MSFVGCLLATWNVGVAADWPHWRGATRNGLANEDSGWDGSAWPLREAWRVKVGEGASSPVVVGRHLFVLGWSDGQDRLACLDVETGKTVWQVSYSCPKYGRLATGDEGLYSGPSSTPEFDVATGLLFTLSTDGDLQCWDTRRAGQRAWGINLYERYQVERRPKVGRSGLRDYGYTSSPLVQDDQLIVEVGAKTGTLMAFDKRTGEEKWRSQATDPAGHNGGPVPIVVDGIPSVAVHHFNGLLVVRSSANSPDAGHTVATWPWRTDFGNNIATVAVQGNSVVMTSSYNQHKIARLDISAGGAKLVWEQPLASKVCSPIIQEGSIYWAWQHVHCLDFATGQPRWRGERLSDPGSCIITADSRLITWTDRGDLRLVETAGRSPNAYRPLATRERVTSEDAWPHVVLANGRLFCKDRAGQLVCLEVKSADSPRGTRGAR